MTGGGIGHVRVITQRATYQWHTIGASTHHSPSYAVSQLLSRLSLVLLGQGTNIYNLLMHSDYSEESIRGTLLERWDQGAGAVAVLSVSGVIYIYIYINMCSRFGVQTSATQAHISCKNFDATDRCVPQVVRAFGFYNGHYNGVKPPIQDPAGVFHEMPLQRCYCVPLLLLSVLLGQCITMLDLCPPSMLTVRDLQHLTWQKRLRQKPRPLKLGSA